MSSLVVKGLVVEASDWNQDKIELIKLRGIVFVDEQNVPVSLEIDGMDPECRHVKAVMDDQTIGTARLLPNGYIGRMCVLKEFRSQGVGTKMLECLIQQAFFDQTTGVQMDEVTLNSQSSAIAFYQANGFIICSEEFLEANIVHRKMVLKRSDYYNKD
ncbi:MAG: putative GNAT family N-acyltransferase [Urechidicola sp.]|jgi:predicted GNAT family N-acyltransferase